MSSCGSLVEFPRPLTHSLEVFFSPCHYSPKLQNYSKKWLSLMAVLFSELAMSAFDHTHVFAVLLALFGKHSGNPHAQQNKCDATGRGLEVRRGVGKRGQSETTKPERKKMRKALSHFKVQRGAQKNATSSTSRLWQIALTFPRPQKATCCRAGPRPQHKRQTTYSATQLDPS